MPEMDCGECGRLVESTARHTFVDCALYAADHLGSGVGLGRNYARALAAEVRSLRSEAEAARRLREAVENAEEAHNANPDTRGCPLCKLLVVLETTA